MANCTPSCSLINSTNFGRSVAAMRMSPNCTLDCYNSSPDSLNFDSSDYIAGCNLAEHSLGYNFTGAELSAGSIFPVRNRCTTILRRVKLAGLSVVSYFLLG